jgi:hypothetical protein
MDRFWLGADGKLESSAAEKLRAHLAGLNPPKAFAPPTPVARFTGLDAPLVIGGSYQLDGSSSVLASSYAWSLEKPQGSAASLAFADTAFAILRDVDLKGEYAVSLSVGEGLPPARRAQQRADEELNAPAQTPRSEVLLGESLAVNALAGFSGGDLQLRLVPGTLQSANAGAVSVADLGNGQIELSALTAADADVEVTFTVADVDNDTIPGRMLVAVKTNLTANPVDAETSVRRTGTSVQPLLIGSLQDQVGRIGDAPLHFCLLVGDVCDEDNEIETIAGTNGTRGTARLTSISAGSIEYRPPAGVMTRFEQVSPANAVRFAGPDQISYRVCYESDQRPESCATSEVRIDIVGRESSDPEADPESAISFAQLYNDPASGHSFSPQCSGCHGDWLDTTDLKNTFCRIAEGSDSLRPDNSNVPYVNKDDPASSALYLKPTGQLDHQRPTTLQGTPAGTPELRARILRWLEQGAYYTTTSDQSCP